MVPIRTLGGLVLEDTIWAIKFAVMPMMEMREIPWRPRATV